MAKGRPLDEHAISGLLGEQIRNSYGFFESELTQSRRKANEYYFGEALNRLIQGSAADQAKQAMVDAYDAGFDMRLPVHDEINCMVNSKKESLDLKLIMENAIQLNVPVIADIDLGKTWC